MSETIADIADGLAALADKVRSLPSHRGWIDEVRRGAILTVDQAAFIAATSGETIRRRCEQSAADDRPLGVKVANIWLIDRAALFDMIEDERGLHDRLAAEDRAQKNARLWSAPQEAAKIAVPHMERATG